MVSQLGLNYTVINLRDREQAKAFLNNKKLISEIKEVLEENNALQPRAKGHRDGKVNANIYDHFKRYADLFLLAHSKKTGELIGVIDGEITPDYYQKDTFNISWIVIKKKYQNQNIGKRIMLRLAEHLIRNDFSEITLHSISVRTDKLVKFLDGKESSLGNYKEDKKFEENFKKFMKKGSTIKKVIINRK